MRPLVAERYDGIFVDLDGVVFRGDQPVEGAGAVLEKVRAIGARVLFLTNNSSRTPEEVASKLDRMGIQADPGEILTSAQATAVMLRGEGAAGRTAFVIGERGIKDALRNAGIEVLDGPSERADMVVVGFDRSADYAKLRTASLLVQRGARLIATNGDASYPAPDGLWPGAGALLAAVVTTTGASPTVVGKPSRPLFEAAAQLTGARNPLVVGDRLDTDVAGAATMGWDSMLVFTGASKVVDLARWDVLPTYLGDDISALLDDLRRVTVRAASAGDVDGIRRLLSDSDLGTDGIDERLPSTVVGIDEGTVVATASVEQFDRSGLLRSVAVDDDLRGGGVGSLVVAAAIHGARRRGIHDLSLFTESAAGFFGRLGFRATEREALPQAVQISAQGAGECAESATAMWMEL